MPDGKRVLVVDDDHDIVGLVRAILEEEGWRVDVLADTAPETVREAVDRLEPDCVLLDGSGPGDYGQAWLDAAAIHARPRPIPVVMFTADQSATAEAQASESARSVAAGFAAVLAKPFNIDALVATVATAVGGDIAGPLDGAQPPERPAARRE